MTLAATCWRCRSDRSWRAGEVQFGPGRCAGDDVTHNGMGTEHLGKTQTGVGQLRRLRALASSCSRFHSWYWSSLANVSTRTGTY